MAREQILRATLSIPTAPFHEHLVARHVRAFARERGLSVRADRFGNLIVRLQRGRGATPIAFVAHMDHPGFEIIAVRGRDATLEPLGDTRGRNALGTRIRAQTANGEVRGVVTAVGQRTTIRFHTKLSKSVTARFDCAVRVGDFAQWDFPAFERRGKRIYSRTIDDVAGCAALLAALDELVHARAAVNFYAIFTRAEEVGFAGATALAQSGLILKRVPIVSIEMSKALRGAEQGKGYVVRLGDRASLFDPSLTQFLLGVARKLGVPFQQRLMDGGTCEATAFNALGYTASGVCVPLGNYHNQGAKRIAPEFIHRDDFRGLVRFIAAAVPRAGEFRPTRPLLKKRVLAILRPYRARLLKTAALSLTMVTLAGADEIPATGEANPDLKSFDEAVIKFMQQRSVPGGALAVVKDGRLVYARGYGWADRDAREPALPTSLFRIASVSKPITGVAIMKLVEDHRYRLKLDAKAFKLLGLEPFLEKDAQVDPRIWDVTIRQLLHHTGGFDREKSGDPMFMSEKIAAALGKPAPAAPEDIIRYMMGRPLDFDPGAREAYSNFGYCVLGRVIEKITGKSYEDFVREEILAPVGIRDMRIGHTLLEQRAKDEVRYYQPRLRPQESVFAKLGETKVANPYGAWYLEAMDAHGGWIASAVDLARFAAALDCADKSEILAPKTLRTMYERPKPPAGLNRRGNPAAAYYALGWNVRPVGDDGGANYWHAGSLPGTATMLVRRHDGLSWVVLFNQRSKTDGEIDAALHHAADAVKKWPDGDLFANYK